MEGVPGGRTEGRRETRGVTSFVTLSVLIMSPNSLIMIQNFLITLHDSHVGPIPHQHELSQRR